MDKQGCEVGSIGAPAPRRVIDMDHPDAPVERARKCDYLLLAEDANPRRLLVVPLELKSTGSILLRSNRNCKPERKQRNESSQVFHRSGSFRAWPQDASKHVPGSAHEADSVSVRRISDQDHELWRSAGLGARIAVAKRPSCCAPVGVTPEQHVLERGQRALHARNAVAEVGAIARRVAEIGAHAGDLHGDEAAEADGGGDDGDELG